MSTPIDKIPDDPHRSLDEDQELVQSIIKEIKQHESGGQSEDLQQEYQEDVPQQFAGMQDSRQPQQQQYYEPPPEQYQAQPARPATKPLSLTQKILNESKDPLIVLLLYAVFGLPILDQMLVKYIPRVMTTAGNVGFIGVIFKGILLTIAFYLVKKLIK